MESSLVDKESHRDQSCGKGVTACMEGMRPFHETVRYNLGCIGDPKILMMPRCGITAKRCRAGVDPKRDAWYNQQS